MEDGAGREGQAAPGATAGGSEGLIRTAEENAPFGAHCYRLESDGRLVFEGANAAADRILGVENEQFVGRTIEEAFPHLVDTEIPEAYRRVAATGEPYEQEQVFYEGGGISGAFEIHAFGTGKNQMAVFFIDILRRKRAEVERLELERRLLHAQKLESLGILAGGIAHDFNNLLMAILGNLDMALEKTPRDSPVRAHLESAAAATHRSADLTRQMLAYSGRGAFVLQHLDLSELVRENAHMLRAAIPRSAALFLNLGEGLQSVEADAAQLQQVVMNLITNAAEAIGDSSGVIRIATGSADFDEEGLANTHLDETPRPGRYVFLEVADTGCGMKREVRERLFDPFFTTKQMGRGLGMSALLGIVRSHRGAIFVESEIGRGTTIRVLLPEAVVNVPAPERDSRVVTQSARPPALEGTVLIVDDEEIVRTVCRDMVVGLGLVALTASGGEEAVRLVLDRPGRLDAVILDLSMPGLDGIATFRELRRVAPGLRVILSSGFHETDAVGRLEGTHPDGFIQKPYTIAKLREALAKVIE